MFYSYSIECAAPVADLRTGQKVEIVLHTCIFMYVSSHQTGIYPRKCETFLWDL